MIKLFSLIFNLCYLSLLQVRTRGEGYASTSLYPPNHQLRYNSKIKNYYELMSHLLYLNSCDNYPNKCPHICLHLLVKQHPNRQGSNHRTGPASSGRRIIRIAPPPARPFAEIIPGISTALNYGAKMRPNFARGGALANSGIRFWPSPIVAASGYGAAHATPTRRRKSRGR